MGTTFQAIVTMLRASQANPAFAALATALVVSSFLPGVGAVRRLHTHRDFKDVLAVAGMRPVIIDFFSQSCGPCHMIAPVFERLSKEYKGRAYFRKVDVNQNYETSSYCNVRSMPTFHFYAWKAPPPVLRSGRARLAPLHPDAGG